MGFSDEALLSVPSQVTTYRPLALKPALMLNSPEPASKVTKSPVWPAVSVTDMSRSPPSASAAVWAETIVVPTGSGEVTVAGRVLAQMPTQTWFRVEIEAALGKAAPRTFQVKLTPAGGATQNFAGLPISGTEFRELVWLGYSSTAAADTVFYLDNVSFPR